MGALKEYFWEELAEDEWGSDPDSDFWDLYDEYMDKRLEGLPLEDIKEVKSYLDRHQWDLAVFTKDMSGSDGDWQELCKEDWCKGEFLMHEMQEKKDSWHINSLQQGIFRYIKENHMDLLFPDR